MVQTLPLGRMPASSLAALTCTRGSRCDDVGRRPRQIVIRACCHGPAIAHPLRLQVQHELLRASPGRNITKR